MRNLAVENNDALHALIQGLVIQLGQIAEQGLVGGDAPAAEEAPAEEAAAEQTSPEPEGDGAETDATDAPSEGDEKE